MVCLEPFAPKIWLAKVGLFRRNSKQGEDVNFLSVVLAQKQKRLHWKMEALSQLQLLVQFRVNRNESGKKPRKCCLHLLDRLTDALV
jgi:hypothetical protein